MGAICGQRPEHPTSANMNSKSKTGKFVSKISVESRNQGKLMDSENNFYHRRVLTVKPDLV